MNCPFCGYDNIAGSDSCESCGEDLTAFDGVRPQDSLEEGLVKDSLLDVAKCDTWSTTADTTILQVAEKMDRDNNCCLIMDGDTLLGIVTMRDILSKALLKDFDLASTPISKIMTPNPDILFGEDKLVHALNLMAVGGYRHVPIKRPEGGYQVISVRDIIAYLAKQFPGALGSKIH
ncbi:MAG: CBS domain-containing protein [bacterium]|nr:CBS domain-containing protein [bacterium]